MKSISTYLRQSFSTMLNNNNWLMNILFLIVAGLAYLVICLICSLILAIPMVLIAMVTGGAGFFFYALLTILFLAWMLIVYPPLFYGIQITFLEVARGENINFSNLFCGYHKRIIKPLALKWFYLMAACLAGLIIYQVILMAFSIPLVIPQEASQFWMYPLLVVLLIPFYYLCYSFSMTENVVYDYQYGITKFEEEEQLEEEEELSSSQILSISKRLMQGHKLKLFLLDLCFGGINIAILAIGILLMFALGEAIGGLGAILLGIMLLIALPTIISARLTARGYFYNDLVGYEDRGTDFAEEEVEDNNN